MKKILFVNNNMHIGGVQKALVNLLWSIHGSYDITLLLFHKGGEYLKEIPPSVKVITPKSAIRYLGMTRNDSLSRKDRLLRGFFAGLTKVLGRNFTLRLMCLGEKKLLGYDVAVSYLHNGGSKMFYGGCNDFVLDWVSASKKIAFLHCDYKLCGANTAENAKQYEKFDVIAACSEGCARVFSQACPHLQDRLAVVPNCHRFEEIRSKAAEGNVILSTETVNVLTVARLGKEKGVERAVRAISQLGPLKNKLHYYIVGDGIQKEVILRLVEDHKLQDIVTLCGMLNNPYGYIKASDLLLIPSYSEAAPLVIAEAACLGTAILSTHTSSAKEMIEEKSFGWVCENSEEGIIHSLKELLTDPSLIYNLNNINSSTDLDNQNAIARFVQCFELKT